MEVKSIIKSPAALALFLLACGVLCLVIRFLGYRFVPQNEFAFSCGIAVIICLLAGIGFKNNNAKFKAATVFSALLPLFAMFVIIVYERAVIIRQSDLYVLLVIITLTLSIVLFFLSTQIKAIKIGLGIAYIVLAFIVFAFSLFLFLTAKIGEEAIIKTEVSPNSMYAARIIDNGLVYYNEATQVTVARNRNVDLILGELRKDSEIIYVGESGAYRTLTIRWETDEILYINDEQYLIQ